MADPGFHKQLSEALTLIFISEKVPWKSKTFGPEESTPTFYCLSISTYLIPFYCTHTRTHTLTLTLTHTHTQKHTHTLTQTRTLARTQTSVCYLMCICPFVRVSSSGPVKMNWLTFFKDHSNKEMKWTSSFNKRKKETVSRGKRQKHKRHYCKSLTNETYSSLYRPLHIRQTKNSTSKTISYKSKRLERKKARWNKGHGENRMEARW